MTEHYIPVLTEFPWQMPVLDKDLSTPPGSPNKGDRYIIGPSATGDWAGHEKDIVWHDGSAWQFVTPQPGWFVWINDENKLYYYVAVWQEYPPGT